MMKLHSCWFNKIAIFILVYVELDVVKPYIHKNNVNLYFDVIFNFNQMMLKSKFCWSKKLIRFLIFIHSLLKFCLIATYFFSVKPKWRDFADAIHRPKSFDGVIYAESFTGSWN